MAEDHEETAQAARKRRKAIISSHRSVEEEMVDDVQQVVDQVLTSDTESNKKRSQIRYDPEVPMTKEQLTAWRREARRVRNRESAAASRAKIRGRITELEAQVEDWKQKYAQAMDRLQELEGST